MQLAHKRREVLKLIIRMMTKLLTSMRSEKKWHHRRKKHYFIACLRTYYEDDEFNSYVKSLTGLAKYIADWRIFYVNTHHGYRLMKFRSILSEISSLSKGIGIISKHEKKRKNNTNQSITVENSKIIGAKNTTYTFAPVF